MMSLGDDGPGEVTKPQNPGSHMSFVTLCIQAPGTEIEFLWAGLPLALAHCNHLAQLYQYINILI